MLRTEVTVDAFQAIESASNHCPAATAKLPPPARSEGVPGLASGIREGAPVSPPSAKVTIIA